MSNITTVERKSDRELVVTRTFDSPARAVYQAWTEPDLLKQWWAPKSMGVSLVGCEVDVRTGGSYRFEFGHGDSPPMAFFGKYIDVAAPSRLVWSNEESEEGAITTVTFDEQAGKTLLTWHELYPTTHAREDAMAGMGACAGEQFDQLDAVLAAQG